MIQDENHPDMVAAHKVLVQRLGSVLGRGRRLDKYLMGEMFDIVKIHREQCRARFIDFPKLVALVIPRLGIVEWKRADLELPSIKVSIVNFVRDHPTATMAEVVQAFKAAWPRISSDDFAAPADNIIQALAKKAPSQENPH